MEGGRWGWKRGVVEMYIDVQCTPMSVVLNRGKKNNHEMGIHSKRRAACRVSNLIRSGFDIPYARRQR